MFVRSLAVFGAAAAFVAVSSADADAFGRRHRGEKVITYYKRFVTPPVYRTATRRVMVRPASCSQYRTPPVYGTVLQPVVVKPAYQTVYRERAVYDRVPVTKQVRRARTRWKRRGCGGDDYRCTITTPAVYRTKYKRVMTQPSRRWVETRPAIMGTVQKRVIVNPGAVKQTCQPAVYETVAEQVLAQPGSEQWLPVRSTAYPPANSGYTPVYQRQPAPYAPAPHRPAPRLPMAAPLK